MMRPKLSSTLHSARKRPPGKAQVLSKRIQDDLWTLTALARKGAPGAPKELLTVAVLSAEWLNFVAKNEPDLFLPLAETRLSWPANYYPHPEAVDKLELLLKSLRLGTKTNINVSGEGKSFSWKTPANVVAIRLLGLVEALQREPIPRDGIYELADCGVGLRPDRSHAFNDAYLRQLAALEEWGQRGAGSLLPPLSRGTAKQWAKETPALFRLVFREDFDQHPKLQDLKRSVSGNRLDAFGKPSRKGDVRKLMVQRVKQAWGSIAPMD